MVKHHCVKECHLGKLKLQLSLKCSLPHFVASSIYNSRKDMRICFYTSHRHFILAKFRTAVIIVLSLKHWRGQDVFFCSPVLVNVCVKIWFCLIVKVYNCVLLEPLV
uniref:Uncharacterized protein n=1 Tax=Micrurus spixii TaxID=129469 RepID=A0A2D4N7S8_9SAUR